MPEPKVVQFPGSHAGDYHAPPASYLGNSLLEGPALGRGLVAYVDIADLDEAGLLGLVAHNNVRAVIDIRPCPVFDRPRFRHKDVVFHLYHRRIPYIELAMLAIWPASERRLGTFMRDETYSAFENGLQRGLTLCLYDADAREDGWLEETRRMIRHSRGFVAELIPTALSGQP